MIQFSARMIPLVLHLDPLATIVKSSVTAPCLLHPASRASSTDCPSTSSPKTVWYPSSQLVAPNVIVNSEPAEFGPAFGAVSYPLLTCLTVKSSSLILAPNAPRFSSPILPPEIPDPGKP